MEKKKLTRKEKFRQETPGSIQQLNKDKNKSQGILFPSLLLVIIGFVLYANTLNHSFTLDDYSVILENRVTKQGPAAIPEIFKTSYRYGYYFTNDNLYRPLVKSMFALEWKLGNGKATLGHWFNVLFYCFTGFILFLALNRITGNMLLAFVTAALFLAHPVHTEVVANIKSRDEILAFLFSVWALERFISAIKNNKTSSFINSGLLYFLALMSKESAITFLAIFPLAAWYFTEIKPVVVLKKMIPLIVAAVLFLFIRSGVLHGITPDSVSIADNLLVGAKDIASRFATAVLILGLYLKILIFPHPLVFDYSYNQIPLVGLSDPWFILSLITYTAMLVFALLTLKKKSLLSFSILFYLITLSVSSNLFMTIGSSMGERFLYTPSLGFCLALAILILQVTVSAKIELPQNFSKAILNSKLLFLLIPLLLLYSVKTISRNPDWKTNYSLYSHDVDLSPNSTRTHYYLGNYLVKPEAWEGKSEQEKREIIYRGIAELKRSIEIYPGFADSYTQLGVAYYKLNNADSAMINYQQALKLNPGFATIHNNIGTVYFSTGKYPEALQAFLKATQLDPHYAEAYANAGSAYGMMQQYDNAISSLMQAVKYDPNYAQAYYFIGLTYGFKGDEANKDIYLEKAFRLDPSLRPSK
jgi:protein O-mannosyl-transferase